MKLSTGGSPFQPLSYGSTHDYGFNHDRQTEVDILQIGAHDHEYVNFIGY